MDYIKQLLQNFLKGKGKELAKKAAQKIAAAMPKPTIPPVAYPYIAIAVVVILIIIEVAGAMYDIDNEEETSSLTNYLPTGWWWPIGSKETITEGDNIYAAGTPALLGDCVTAVGASGGGKWGISAGDHNHSSNIGLDVASHGETNKHYVVSVGLGKVTGVADNIAEGCVDLSGSSYNGGMGNYVIVDYGDMIVRYMHLYHGSVKVKVGDEVDYGQVLGTIGYNGASSGAHSHTDYQDKSGKFLDPTDIVDPNNPRPMEAVSATGSVSGTSAAKEFVRVSENDTMRRYISGEITDYNYSPYIYNYITQDKKYYLMGNDYSLDWNGNYGFGVCFYIEYKPQTSTNPFKGTLVTSSNGYFGASIDYFTNKKYINKEYNLRTDTKYQKFYESKIPVEDVDAIEDGIFKEKQNYVKDKADEYGVSLKQNQVDALADFCYRGDSILPVLTAMQNGQTVTQSTANGFQIASGTYGRGNRRWKLFSEGKYLDDNGNEIKVSNTSGSSSNSDSARISRYSHFTGFGGSTDILEVAEKMHTEMEEANYVYYTNHPSGINSLTTTYAESKKYKSTCCATYVSWVLQECGYISDSEHFNGCSIMDSLLTSKGFKKYKNGKTQLQAGDIIVYYGYDGSGSYRGDHYHTDIYAKDGKVLSAGWDITCHYSNMSNTNDYYIYRSPNSGSSSSSSSLSSLLKKADISENTLNSKAQQLVVVNSKGTSATVSFYEKSGSSWKKDDSLTCNGYVGKDGVGQASESSSYSPKGLHAIGEAFYKNSKPTTGLKSFNTYNQYWIDDPDSSKYNERYKGNYKSVAKSAEDMYNTAVYEYGFVIKYNMPPTGKARGSAFFFHISSGGPTAGCIAVDRKYVLKYLEKLDANKKPYILIV